MHKDFKTCKLVILCCHIILTHYVAISHTVKSVQNFSKQKQIQGVPRTIFSFLICHKDSKYLLNLLFSWICSLQRKDKKNQPKERVYRKESRRGPPMELLAILSHEVKDSITFLQTYYAQSIANQGRSSKF